MNKFRFQVSSFKNNLHWLILSIILILLVFSCVKKLDILATKSFTISKEILKDKIKGGWAGQTIGVVYGAPTEFKFQGTTVQEYQNIPWWNNCVKYWWDKKPGLFDDIYNDLTFVGVFERCGVQTPIDTFAYYFAKAEYHLAHANQAARYNIRNGIMPPASGNWINNPHADDLDFQIESDFIGLMAPGMVNVSTGIANKIGHIMNSGDGFYGGAFASALYSLAFVSNDVNYIVEQAIKVIPEKTKFNDCIKDVIKWHKQYAKDWQTTWFELHKKWNKDIGCPKGVFLSFNIDAKMNSAYVALALLYGQGDFTKSVDIAARCGQDSDCNPSTVGGVLGVMLGYSKIPDFWIKPLHEIEGLNFQGTDISMNKAYELSYKHALKTIELNNGKIDGENITIPLESPKALAFEQNFEKTNPVERNKIDSSFRKEYSFSFNGNGYVLYGNLIKNTGVSQNYIKRITNKFGSEIFALAELTENYVADVEVYIDNKLDSKMKLPMKNTSRRLEPSWKYLLKEENHTVTIKWLNPKDEYQIRLNDLIVYSENPIVSNLPK